MDSATPYRVLARKYRPQLFDDLIGQEPMVRTLGNAFAQNRIHQAYIFTGVRGVGKTTTARILARAFNYEREDGSGGPSIDLAVPGKHCQAIIEGRHPDVIEMDAASHTGIDDIRDVIEKAQYRPIAARTKVFIIDEVHMLSKNAFNGLLKTLEEPPPHVKFLFATTEIRKVPVTVLSRCQRFDLRRVEMAPLIAHLSSICAKENVAVEEGALRLIARASEGSVRDSLSLLDQAIAYGAGDASMTEANIRSMIGLADRARVLDLFEAVMKGDMPGALGLLKAQHDEGAEPSILISDLAETVHLVTRLKLTPDSAKDEALSESERTRGAAFAQDLPIRVLTRAWQLLLKGLQEVQQSERPFAAAEMVLVRLAYAADLPTPDDALRSLARSPESEGQRLLPRGPNGGGAMAMGASRPAIARSNPVPQTVPTAQAQPVIRLESFAAFAALLQTKREIGILADLERFVRPVRFEPGIFEFSAVDGAPRELANAMRAALDRLTGMRWTVALSNAKGDATLLETRQAKKAEEERGVRAHPVVKAVLATFPGAEIVAIRKPKLEDDKPAAAEEADLDIYEDDIITDDDL
jgi:DNA polymerase III subunit gamma/tau